MQFSRIESHTLQTSVKLGQVELFISRIFMHLFVLRQYPHDPHRPPVHREESTTT